MEVLALQSRGSIWIRGFDDFPFPSRGLPELLMAINKSNQFIRKFMADDPSRKLAFKVD